MTGQGEETDAGQLLRFGRKLSRGLCEFNDRNPAHNLNRGLRRALARFRWHRPKFAKCWLVQKPPTVAKLRRTYNVNGTVVKLFELPGGAESLYHAEPEEYRLSVNKLELIEKAILELKEHLPEDLSVFGPEKVKEYVEALSRGMIDRYCRSEGVHLGRTRTEELAEIKKLSGIVVKYTSGFGLLEVLLKDKHVQDIYIDAPVADDVVYLSMGFVDDPRLGSKFRTNIIMTNDAAESIMSRFRYESGRPFSEAHPHLECDNDMFNTRVTIIGPPLSPGGMAFALRRHSPEPWTLPRLIAAGSLDAKAAGLISFLLDGQSTMLIAGGRGAGKSSLLGAIMFEFSPVQRILTVEDTLELPVPKMKALGYKLQSMLIQSSVRGSGSMTADEALRISLRLGESAIVLGEVRGAEARTLYEAMRAGTAGSAVLGTFHADSAKAVFERVVYDMGISREAFSATDIVIIAGLTRPAGIQRQERRVTEIAELVKNSPEPGTFANLLSYDPVRDGLIDGEVLDGSSVRLRSIARSWGINYEECLENINARSKIREMIVDRSMTGNTGEILSAEWVLSCNSMFRELMQVQFEKEGVIDHKKLINDWKKWFGKALVYGL